MSGGAGDAPPGAGGLVPVMLVQLPLRVWDRAREHNDELMREFALITMNQARPQPVEETDPSEVPARLLALVEELSGQYAATTADVNAERDAAIAGGGTEIDLAYRVPPQAAEAARRLGTLLDEADAYCRAGQHLLTLATPPEAVRFRRWYLTEFVAQIGGSPPTAWPDYRDPDDDSGRDDSGRDDSGRDDSGPDDSGREELSSR